MNNRRKNKLPLLLTLLLLPLLASLGARPATAAALRLIYGNDNLGELDGCG